jgi:hypothetical protein
MKKLVLRLTVPIVCLILLAHASKTNAQTPVSGTQAAGIFGVLIGEGVGVGVGAYFLVRAPHNITGCVSNDGGTLQLSDEKSMNRYLLEGDSGAVMPGQRVRISGKPGKDASKRRTFFVSKVSGNTGHAKRPCPEI